MKKFSPTSKNREVGILTKAEAKILFIMIYYILLGTLVLALFTYIEATSDVEYRVLEVHFACQSTGVQPGKDCGVTPQVQLSTLTSLSAVAILLTGLFPMVVIAFTVRCKCNNQSEQS